MTTTTAMVVIIIPVQVYHHRWLKYVRFITNTQVVTLVHWASTLSSKQFHFGYYQSREKEKVREK